MINKIKNNKLTAFGHSDHKTLFQSTAFARCSVFLVDDALAIVFALTQCVQIVVRAPKEGLWKENSGKISKR